MSQNTVHVVDAEESEMDGNGVVTEHHALPPDTEARILQGQTGETKFSTSANFTSGTTEFSSVLYETYDTVKDIVMVLKNLQRPMEEGVRELKNLAVNLVTEAKQTNHLLQILIREIGQLDTARFVPDSTEQGENVHQHYQKKDSIALTDGQVEQVHPLENDEENENAQLFSLQKEFDSSADVDMLCQQSSNSDQGNCEEKGSNPSEQDIHHLDLFPQQRQTSNADDEPAECNKEIGNENPQSQHNTPPDEDETASGSFEHTICQGAVTPESKAERERPERDGNPSPGESSSETEKQNSENNTAQLDATEREASHQHTQSRSLEKEEWSFKHNLQIWITSLCSSFEGSSADERQLLEEAVQRACAPESHPSPMARSFSTVVCLDISKSMENGGAYKEMISAAHQFINGIEDIACDVEENIALVTFGGSANVVQHLTNDFTLIRNAMEYLECGGKSPFSEAMLVCLAAIYGRGGTVSVLGKYDVHPRIIFFTDGHITEGSDDPDSPDITMHPSNDRAKFARLMSFLRPSKYHSMQPPIMFVPVGSHADKVFLESVAKQVEGHLVESSNVQTLCNYYRTQEAMYKVIADMDSEKADVSEHQIQMRVKSLAPDITNDDMSLVIRHVLEETQIPDRKGESTKILIPFDDVFEDKEAVKSGQRLPLGSRVTRGPDWCWGDQDGGIGAYGTVIQHGDGKQPSTWVLWDTRTCNRYAYGEETGYHVWKAEHNPVPRHKNGELQIGMTVNKGPKWKSSECEEPGVVIRISEDGKQVKVRWKNGLIQACSADSVEFSDQHRQNIQEKREGEISLEEELFGHSLDLEEDGASEKKVFVWQWRDDWGNWRLYSPEETESLEKAYQRKKKGSCIIQRNEENFRVFFQRMVERNSDVGTERDVQRVMLSEEDLESLMCAEKIMSSD